MLYYFANPNQECVSLFQTTSDYYTYPYVCSYAAANCGGSCINYYLNGSCTKTGSGDSSKGARYASQKVILVEVGGNNQPSSSNNAWYSSTGAIVGFSIGGVALLVIVAAVVFFVVGAGSGGWSLYKGGRSERKSVVELDATINALRTNNNQA